MLEIKKIHPKLSCFPKPWFSQVCHNSKQIFKNSIKAYHKAHTKQNLNTFLDKKNNTKNKQNNVKRSTTKSSNLTYQMSKTVWNFGKQSKILIQKVTHTTKLPSYHGKILTLPLLSKPIQVSHILWLSPSPTRFCNYFIRNWK